MARCSYPLRWRRDPCRQHRHGSCKGHWPSLTGPIPRSMARSGQFFSCCRASHKTLPPFVDIVGCLAWTLPLCPLQLGYCDSPPGLTTLFASRLFLGLGHRRWCNHRGIASKLYMGSLANLSVSLSSFLLIYIVCSFLCFLHYFALFLFVSSIYMFLAYNVWLVLYIPSRQVALDASDLKAIAIGRLHPSQGILSLQEGRSPWRLTCLVFILSLCYAGDLMAMLACKRAYPSGNFCSDLCYTMRLMVLRPQTMPTKGSSCSSAIYFPYYS
ncbi:hypothetical protein BO94DRAFT_162765 [Aspergillus sclerotioniger CBS 115572]|uniref:Uncharacterized protein n=1 Tax=Aspergillus sclerotioniger CBS 115572 TaxID=1450535 RepID=A0A317W1L1_9EURO|nr:hypothetical protein BO94DRAFT_162765 [Aspergillus sclerotioniger CBS 115572]PWY80464.1 hypothetical protein BO94DRAFT_162765 [Aspergillus sclerotioniger CBS 115572]